MKRLASYAFGDFGQSAKIVTQPFRGLLNVEIGTEYTNGDNSSLGSSSTVPISGNLQDVDTIQYKYLTFRDGINTFSPQNSLVYLVVVLYYDSAAVNPPCPPGLAGKYAQWFIPICLPWKRFSFEADAKKQIFTSTNNDPESSDQQKPPRTILKRLQDQLVYSLNIAWTIKDNPKGYPGIGSLDSQVMPVGNGWVLSPQMLQRVTPNSSSNPMWVNFDSNPNYPCLQWFLTPNGQLGIKRVGTFNDGSAYGCARFGINLMSAESFFFNQSNYFRRDLNLNVPPGITPTECPGPAVISSMIGPNKGWFGRTGQFVFGFGERKKTTEQVLTSVYYSDEYNSLSNNGVQLKKDLFNRCTPAPGPDMSTPDWYVDFVFDDYAAFKTYCNTYLLHEDILIANRILSLLPSRSYTVNSQILTLNERLRCESNNYELAGSKIVALLPPIPPSSKINSTSDSNSNHPVIHSHGGNPKNTVDLFVLNEFAQPIQNPNAQIPELSDRLFQFNQRNCFPPWNYNNDFGLVPPGISALNPDPVTFPDGDCLLGAVDCTSQLGNILTTVNLTTPEIGRNINDEQFDINCPLSAYHNHVFETIGYFT